ncbi:hypothetical protein [Gemmatimonas sp. UBA7669]|uniref:hypothetical protein n=1 Tax=Gemmatimonas sp. UBA7669 TaxID=1946568 RepID=UPI0025C543F5|nr:hypothetical protein [Gemmatimonas sp. UBA7669]
MTETSRTFHWGWLAVALAGVLLPALAMLRVDTMTLAAQSGPILAAGLMGTGMIAAAVAARFWMGVALALTTGVGFIALAQRLGMAPLVHPLSTTLALLVASISFAARGTLFTRAHPRHGWIIAVLVVCGEAATLLTAAWLPDWLLVLLPAQWASAAIATAIVGSGTRAALAVLMALAGTAATTLLVARLLPRKWPYALMFTAWLALSAYVARS